ncbi:hypothetical protein [Nonomuraea dietziae]|uniref:hypothetical protein n=1 Tax=Nonomuraea dietziae TaxID=65515 RepID=UPI003410AD66
MAGLPLRDLEGLTPLAQIRVQDGKAVGCTAFWDPRYWPGRQDLRAVEVGWKTAMLDHRLAQSNGEVK